MPFWRKKDPSKHLFLDRNKRGRDFLLGDLHAETDMLVRALKVVGFDTSVDRVISVGDLIDRGPDSLGALELIEEDWFFAVRGNHETMLIENTPDSRYMHLHAGGEWAYELDEDAHNQAIELAARLPHAITLTGPNSEIIGICHAEWPARDWARIETALTNTKTVQAMIWGRSRIRSQAPQRDRTADLLVHGHTPIETPLRLGDALFIDTGAVYGGELTLMEVPDALTFGTPHP